MSAHLSFSRDIELLVHRVECCTLSVSLSEPAVHQGLDHTGLCLLGTQKHARLVLLHRQQHSCPTLRD